MTYALPMIDGSGSLVMTSIDGAAFAFMHDGFARSIDIIGFHPVCRGVFLDLVGPVFGNIVMLLHKFRTASSACIDGLSS